MTTSILIPVYNNADYTENCILSIYNTTTQPIEMIIVDNASSDRTPRLLKQLNSEKPDNIIDFKIFRNQKNEGVVKAFNKGIKEYTGEYLLLQNNDCLMADSWLEELINAIESSNQYGIAAPLANLFEGKTHPHPQLIYADYTNPEEMQTFASTLKSNEEIATEAEYVFGHSMLIKKEVLENIDGFDTRFGIGYFEEIDFCKRANNAGYKSIVANHSYVHHFGNKTLDLLKIDREKLKEKNKQIFEDKWNNDFKDKL